MLCILSVFRCSVSLLVFLGIEKNIISYFLVVGVVEEKIVEKSGKYLKMLEKLRVGGVWKMAGNGS